MAEPKFKDGKKINPDGTICDLVKLKESLSSNGHTIYLTSLWSDGEMSCDCPGWTIKRGATRKCKHTRASGQCDHSDMQDVNNFESMTGSAPINRSQVVLPAREHRGIKIKPKS